jgi:hypothetical protein
LLLFEWFIGQIFDQKYGNGQIDEVEEEECHWMFSNEKPGNANCSGDQITNQTEWSQLESANQKGIG